MLPKSRNGFASTETIEIIQMSCVSRMVENRDYYRSLTHLVTAQRIEDQKRYVKNITEEVEDNFPESDLQLTYSAMKKLRFKSISQVSSIRMADGLLVSDIEDYRVVWARYFEHLYRDDPPY